LNIFYQNIYTIVAKIPQGKVVSYGKIAAALGRPRASREVGRAMRICPAEDIPWQRVVMADGSITGGEYAEMRKAMLETEGIIFTPDGRVDMEACCMDAFELELIALSIGGEAQCNS